MLTTTNLHRNFTICTVLLGLLPTLPGLAADGITNDQIRVSWTENGNWLWYERDIPSGSDSPRFIKVDAVRGEKLPLFDSGLLAQALAEASQRDVKAIPLQRIDVLRLSEDGAGFSFRFEGKTYEANADYQLSSIDVEADYDQLLTRRARSGSSDSEMELLLHNLLDQPIVGWWLSTNGTAVEYARVEPGESYAQHTFAGHIWSVRSDTGEELIRVAATPDQSVVKISAEALEAFKNLPARGESRPRSNRRQSGRRGNASSDRISIRNDNLWITEGDNAARQLTNDGSPQRRYRAPWLVSPSGQFLATIQEQIPTKRQVTIVESSPGAGQQPLVHTFEYTKPGDEIDKPILRLFDLHSGSAIPLGSVGDTNDPFATPHPLMDNPWSLRLLDWTSSPERETNSPERILCLYNQRGHQHVRLLAIDPRTGAVEPLVDEHSPTFIDYAHKTFYELIDDNQALIWMSERSGFNHLFKVNTTDGSLTELTAAHLAAPALVRDVEQVDEGAGCIWFSASGLVAGQDPYFRHLCRVDLDGGSLVRLTDGDGDHRWEFSPDRRFIIDRFSRVDMPTVTNLRSASDGRLVCELERGDFSELVDSGWSIPEPFVAKGRDGQTNIYGVIVRPRDFDPARKYPVVEKVYAGPQSAYVPKGFSRMRQEHELADMGCIVVMVDGMGTSHRGKAFHDVCWKNLADAGFPDRIAWIKAAAAEYPEFDLSRVGTFGGSAGGQNAMRALLDHHDFYKVAVADCGCHDNRMDKIWWNEAWMGWPIDDSYAASSNVDHAHRLQGKLLLIVGELDRNVDPASTMQVVDALVRADKDFELLIIPGAGHGAAETRYGSRRRAQFLQQHLGF